MKTKGSVNPGGGAQKPSAGPCVQERSPAPPPLNNMMSGRLLRAQKQAKARVGVLSNQLHHTYHCVADSAVEPTVMLFLDFDVNVQGR